MHPILFEILGFPVRSFGLMVVAGFLVGTHLFGRLGTRYAHDPEKEAKAYSALPVWMLIGVLLGARVLYIIVEVLRDSETGRAYLENPLKMLAYWEGGLVMYGGFAGAVIGGMWCAKRQGLQPLHVLDIGLPSGFVGLAIGRIGCLLVGDDYGKIVPEGARDLPFPLVLKIPEVLPGESLFGPENAGQVLWATQVWMCLNALLIAWISWRILRRRRYTGQVALWVFLMYAITRSTIEAFRGDGVRGLWIDGALSTSQLISVVVGLIAVLLLVLNRGRSDPLPDARSVAGEG